MAAVVKRHIPFNIAKAAIVFLFCVLTCSVSIFTASAQAKVAFADATPSTFTIYVGYSGGPYYAKTVYSNADMWAMSDGAIYEYSSIDSSKNLRKGFGQGIVLSNLLANAGVAVSVERYYFNTADSYGGTTDGALTAGDPWSYDELIGKTRYYYPDYPTHWSWNLHGVFDKDGLEATRVQVPSILALKSSFLRITSQEECDMLWNDSGRMSTNAGYRLMFGAESSTVGTARSFAAVVVGITCIMPGYIEVSFPSNVIEGEVGDVIDLTPTISSSTGELDSTIAANAAKDVQYVSSNTDIAQVFQKADGTWAVKINGEGSFSIGYSYSTSAYDYYKQGSTGYLAGTGDGTGDSGDGSGSGEDGNNKGAGDDGSGTGGGGDDGTGGGTGKADGKGEGENSNVNDPTPGEQKDMESSGGNVSGDEGESGESGETGTVDGDITQEMQAVPEASANTLVAYELNVMSEQFYSFDDVNVGALAGTGAGVFGGGFLVALFGFLLGRDNKVKLRIKDVGGAPSLIEKKENNEESVLKTNEEGAK